MTLQTLKNAIKRQQAARPWHRVAGRVLKPRPGQLYASWLDVDGWALSLDGAEVEVSIVIDGQKYACVTPELASPYVAQMYPALPKSGRCGFHATLRQPGASTGGQVVTVTAAAVSEDGVRGRSRLLQRVPVRYHAGAGGIQHRQDYGEVWDRGTRKLENAQLAVAGTADPREYRDSGRATAVDIQTACGITTQHRVLEIGCGTGRVGLHLAPWSAHWTGGDVSANMLKHAEQTLSGLPNVTLTKLNGVDLAGLADQSYDAVYCSGVFMHLDEWDRFRYVTEAFRVLVPGGRLYVDNMNLLGAEGWQLFLKMSGHDPLDRPANISKMSTPEELRAYVTNAGFVDLHVRPADLWVTVTARKP